MNVSRTSDEECPASLISVVVPCFNEEEVIGATCRRLVEALESLGPRVDFELVFIDDGSRDHTLERLRSLRIAAGYRVVRARGDVAIRDRSHAGDPSFRRLHGSLDRAGSDDR